MNHINHPAHPIARRWFLEQCGVGLGAIAVNQLLQESGYAAGSKADGTQDPLAPHQPHHPPKAKNIIFLFMGGGPSHLELFDNKPVLGKFDGQLPPEDLLKGYRAAFIDPKSKFLGPKFKFAKHGECGAEVSEILPHLAEVVDDIAIVKSMKTDAFNHAPAQIQALTGSQLFGKPSLGAWTIYGLGSESKNLPGFVVFSSGNKGPSGGSSCWGSGFLPTVHQGVMFRGGQEPVLYLQNPDGVDRGSRRLMLDRLRELHEFERDATGDAEIDTRIAQYEMAYRMQASVPEATDLSGEPESVKKLYGPDVEKPGSFAYNCLMARRMAERGVKFIQLYHQGWDQHGGLKGGISKQCQETDQPSAGLVQDLKQRGMLEDTLVIWGGEFGRTNYSQGKLSGDNFGRDHHPRCFSMWFAGGGIKPGTTVGETDEYGYNVVQDPVHVHDFHATLMHLLGIDHERLTYRFQGRRFRLTDVHGHLVKGMLA